MQLGAVCPYAAFAVTDDRVVLPAVPYVGDSVDEFVGLRIAVGVLRVEPLAERSCGKGRDGGDDVPAGAAPTEMIQRRESAGQLPRLAVGRRARPDQPMRSVTAACAESTAIGSNCV